MSNQDLEHLVLQLAKARREESRAKDAVYEIKAKFELPMLSAQEWFSLAKDETKNLEAQVREAALKEHNETGNKKLVDGKVQIKIYDTLDYDLKTALNYARIHLPNAVKLNKSQFDKAAKVLNLEFVKIDQEPRATIARNLSSLLKV